MSVPGWTPQTRELIGIGRVVQISLEAGVWDVLDGICRRERMSIHALTRRIDARRPAVGLDEALALFALAYWRPASGPCTASGSGRLDAALAALAPPPSSRGAAIVQRFKDRLAQDCTPLRLRRVRDIACRTMDLRDFAVAAREAMGGPGPWRPGEDLAAGQALYELILMRPEDWLRPAEGPRPNPGG
ncbi:MAG TPA: ribbon-helix-helix domain-containing protein [Azospirillum sp.]